MDQRIYILSFLLSGCTYIFKSKCTADQLIKICVRWILQISCGILILAWSICLCAVQSHCLCFLTLNKVCGFDPSWKMHGISLNLFHPYETPLTPTLACPHLAQLNSWLFIADMEKSVKEGKSGKNRPQGISGISGVTESLSSTT